MPVERQDPCPHGNRVIKNGYHTFQEFSLPLREHFADLLQFIWQRRPNQQQIEAISLQHMFIYGEQLAAIDTPFRTSPIRSISQFWPVTTEQLHLWKTLDDQRLRTFSNQIRTPNTPGSQYAAVAPTEVAPPSGRFPAHSSHTAALPAAKNAFLANQGSTRSRRFCMQIRAPETVTTRSYLSHSALFIGQGPNRFQQIRTRYRARQRFYPLRSGRGLSSIDRRARATC